MLFVLFQKSYYLYILRWWRAKRLSTSPRRNWLTTQPWRNLNFTLSSPLLLLSILHQSQQTPVQRLFPHLLLAKHSVYILVNSTASLTSENELLTSHFCLLQVEMQTLLFFYYKHMCCTSFPVVLMLIQDS